MARQGQARQGQARQAGRGEVWKAGYVRVWLGWPTLASLFLIPCACIILLIQAILFDTMSASIHDPERNEDLHPLPDTDTIAAEAVRSVHRRGFYDSTPHVANDPHVMAQVLRLVEEVGEFQHARLYNAPTHEKAKEVADIAIVAYQLAWLTGVPLDALHPKPLASTSFSVEVGALARALRKWTGRTLDNASIATALARIMALCYITCEQMGQQLAVVVADKLAADEQRGYQHNGKVV